MGFVTLVAYAMALQSDGKMVVASGSNPRTRRSAFRKRPGRGPAHLSQIAVAGEEMKTNRTTGLSMRVSIAFANMVLAVFLVVYVPTIRAATFTVATTTDGGPGSLRQAVIDANAAGGANVIN